MFQLQIDQARDIVRRIDLCKKMKNDVPDLEKVSVAELNAWTAASAQLVKHSFGKGSDELKRYRELDESIPQLQSTALKRDGSDWTWTYWIDFFQLMIGLLQEFEAKWNARDKSLVSEHVQTQSCVDVAILTVLPEEFQAVCTKVTDLQAAPPRHDHANLYAWQTGTVASKNGPYSVAVGIVGRAGTNKSAMATLDAVLRWPPRYILLVGIAGGLKDVDKGDVVIADAIYGYEYGKFEQTFSPRDRKYDSDTGLFNGAIAHGLSPNWKALIKVTPPTKASAPKVVRGEIASGDKVVDDPTNAFFVQVLKKWPKINAVEMEGAGACEAIEQANALNESVGFLMIRGISDLPRPVALESVQDASHGTSERDAWKNYAAETAAAFTVSFIATNFPMPPAQRQV